MEKKIAIYSRKSKFTGKGDSIGNQIEICKAYIKGRHSEITDSDILVFEDEGYSGKNTKRPQFQQLMSAVRAKQISGIICYRMDRISRSVADFANLINELGEYGIWFDSVSEKVDTSTSMGKAMMYICSIFAQLERETTAERIRDNMYELAKTGRWLGGNTPTGYRSEKIVDRLGTDGKERTAFKLELIPEEAELVKLVFGKFIEYNSLSKTETYFLQNRIKTKTGKEFTRFTLKAILQNPVYMIADADAWKYFEDMGVEIFADREAFDGVHGLMGYNKTKQHSGRANIVREIEEWVIAVGKHEGIISGGDWVKAQNNLNQNKSRSYRKPRSNTALMSGVLICGNCGGFMRPKMYNQDFEEGEKRFSYLCETKEKSKQCNCNIKNPNGNLLDRMVCDEIKKIAENSSCFLNEIKKSRLNSANEELERQLEKLESSIDEKKKEIANLVDALAKASGTVAADYINGRITELDKEIKEAENSLRSLREVTKESELDKMEVEVLGEMLTSFADSFETMRIEQKRAAIRTFIDKIVWDGENVHMYFCQNVEPLSKNSK